MLWYAHNMDMNERKKNYGWELIYLCQNFIALDHKNNWGLLRGTLISTFPTQFISSSLNSSNQNHSWSPYQAHYYIISNPLKISLLWLWLNSLNVPLLSKPSTIFEHIKEIYYNILLVKTTQIILLCVAYFLHAKQNK